MNFKKIFSIILLVLKYMTFIIPYIQKMIDDIKKYRTQ